MRSNGTASAAESRVGAARRLGRRRVLEGALAILVAAACGGLSACGASTDDAAKHVRVFAAASLTDVMGELATAWKGAGGAEARFSFGATSKLVPQLIEGAPADVFVSADEAWMAKLEAAGQVEGGTRAVIARNELVFVVPSDAKEVPSSAAALPGGLKRIAMAGENVPAGKYGKAAFEAANVWKAVEPLVKRGDDVRVALKWVESGDADGGVVYRTDAKVAGSKVKTAFEFASTSHPPIVYPAAVVKGSAHKADAARFLEFCKGPTGRAIFEKHGFLLPTA